MKGVANLQKMIKAAKEMQEKLQKELAEMRVEGTSGGGMVTVTLDGQKNLMSVWEWVLRSQVFFNARTK
jgi:DNA-binding protein YbaB